MPEPPDDFQRILVALDLSQDSLAALEAAAALATRLGTDLVGLFIEDIDLLRAAALPFTRQISLLGQQIAPLEVMDIEREFSVQIAAIRRRLGQLERERRIRWELRVERGRWAETLAEAAGRGDLVAMKVPSGGAGARMLTEPPAGQAESVRDYARLLIAEDRPSPASIAVVYDGSMSTEKALTTGASLAERQRTSLLVLALARTAGEADELSTKALHALPALARPSFQPIVPGSAAGLIAALRKAQPQMCVCNLAPGELGLSLEALARGSGCSILCCRP